MLNTQINEYILLSHIRYICLVVYFAHLYVTVMCKERVVHLNEANDYMKNITETFMPINGSKISKPTFAMPHWTPKGNGT